MKKVWSNFRDFEEVRQKRLDKVSDLLYNIRTRYREMKYIKTDFSNSINPELSKTASEILSSFQQKLLQVHEATNPGDQPPVIAGGAVRDALLGVYPKDIDVFYPVRGDLDDESVYFTETLRAMFPENDFTIFTEVNSKAYDAMVDKDICIYRGYGRTDGDRIFQIDVMTMPEQPIGTIIDGFDHALVKCYYDGAHYYASEEFLDAIRRKRVECASKKTERRLLDWRYRSNYKITIGRPPRETPNKDVNIWSTSSVVKVGNFVEY